MKKEILIFIGMALLSACSNSANNDVSHHESQPLIGTWKLITGTTIKNLDTTVTDYTKDQEMIKIISPTHFSFLRHDLRSGKDSSAVFVAGGGRIQMNDTTYTEFLDYCNYREWEGNKFELAYKISGDSLITTGIEKVEKAGVDHINIETFIKVK